MKTQFTWLLLQNVTPFEAEWFFFMCLFFKHFSVWMWYIVLLVLFPDFLCCLLNPLCLVVFQAAEQQSTEEDVSITVLTICDQFSALTLPLLSHLCSILYANACMVNFYFLDHFFPLISFIIWTACLLSKVLQTDRRLCGRLVYKKSVELLWIQ